MLRIDMKPGESVRIGDVATITMEEKSGQRARIAFDADRSVPIEKVRQRRHDASVAAEMGISGAAARGA